MSKKYTVDTSVMEPLDIETCKKLHIGQILYHMTARNADGSCMRGKVTRIKTWKRDPNKIELHCKHGMYDFASFDKTELGQLSVIDGTIW